MNAAQEKEALLWGMVGVTLFAATLPMTRLAVGTTELPQLSPWFVTFGRAAAAGLLSIGYLLWQHRLGRLKVPRREEWPLLAVTAFGVIVGFPLFLALALRHVPSTPSHRPRVRSRCEEGVFIESASRQRRPPAPGPGHG